MVQETTAGSPWTWIDDKTFELRGTRFRSGTMPMGLSADEFLVAKPPDLTRKYLELVRAEAPQRIVEIGVKAGGSTAMIALLADPRLLLAIDLAQEVPPLLTRFLHDRDLEHRVVTAFGTDQGDQAALTRIVDDARSSEPLDLIIDDGSHILGPTRASFEVLFPRLRPGGLFVIEDWSSECTVARHLAQALPEGADVSERLDGVNRVFHILNDPDGTLPPAVTDSMKAVAAARAGDPSAAPLDLFELLATAAATADLGDLADGRAGSVRPVADLAVELMMLAATAPEVVAEVRIDSHWLTVRRGGAELPVDDFRLDRRWNDFFGYLPGSRSPGSPAGSSMP